jgi:hypothetical protein
MCQTDEVVEWAAGKRKEEREKGVMDDGMMAVLLGYVRACMVSVSSVSLRERCLFDRQKKNSPWNKETVSGSNGITAENLCKMSRLFFSSFFSFFCLLRSVQKLLEVVADLPHLAPAMPLLHLFISL